MPLPHEGHVPTLPGRSNTGERHIYYLAARRLPSGSGCGSEYLVGGMGTSGGKISQKNGLARYFPDTSEGFAAAIVYRDAVLNGSPTSSTPPRDPFQIWRTQQRDDVTDRGFRGTQRRQESTAEGRHAPESDGLHLGPGDEFATSADGIPKVLGDIGKQLARRYFGLPVGRVVTVLAKTSPDLVKFAASLGIEVVAPETLVTGNQNL